MRLVIFGHSDSAGVVLPDKQQAWPWLVARDLETEREEGVDIVHKTVSPLRAGLVEFVAETVSSADPDVVCLAVNPYWFAATTVNLRLKSRFGEKTAAWAQRVEVVFDRQTRARGDIGRRINRAGRTVARRTLGTAAPADLSAVTAAYTAVLSRLSQFEHLPVIVLAGNRLPQYTARNPRLRRQVDQFVTTMESTSARHHFLWFDTDSTFGRGDRSDQQLPDGVHRNVLGHERFAELILPVIREACPVRAH